MIKDVATVDAYLHRYGCLLAERAHLTLDPLHFPGRDPLHPVIETLKRQPFEAQAHVITGAAKALRRQNALFVIGECGVGKTIQGMAILHCRANGKPYRAIVMCPGHITEKWQREISDTIPGATATVIHSWRDLVRLREKRGEKPSGAEWYVIARDRCKLGPKWKPAYIEKHETVYCPDCGQPQLNEDHVPIPPAKFGRTKKRNCNQCDSPLWSYTSEIDRAEPAKFIHKRMKGFFRFLVLDEVHEMKSADTAQANAAGTLAASVCNTIALTGTLLGGYAEHLRPIMFRLCPTSLIEEGLTWKNATPFNERYGRLETVIKTKCDNGSANRQSRGSSKSTTVRVRPGIMPTIFGRHLLGNAVFLSLADVAAQLPDLDEQANAVDLGEVEFGYRALEQAWAKAMKDRMLAKGPNSLGCLLGPMLSSLMLYPDHPFGWNDVGYKDPEDGDFVLVHRPHNMSTKGRLPKESFLVDAVRHQWRLGRQSWVYCTYNGEMDVQERIVRLLSKEGFRVGQLRASVDLANREAWIAENGSNYDVIVSHPRLVETGLDFFDKKAWSYNYSSLIWYETGYNLFTLRQASRRAWRIGQPNPCVVTYLYYDDSMQSRAMALMGRKLAAAQAIDGKFSTDGLAALAEDETLELAIARSLADQLDEDAGREWAKIGGKTVDCVADSAELDGMIGRLSALALTI